MPEATIKATTAACADGFVEETAAVTDNAARFDVLKWDFHFADGAPYFEAFFR